MKRRILVTVLALLLALGALVTLNSGISRTALPIEMQVLTSLGDSGAAQGLMVDYRIALDSCLLWYTKYDPASGANRTDFHVTSHRETTTVLPYGLLGEEYNDWWIVSGLLDERDPRPHCFRYPQRSGKRTGKGEQPRYKHHEAALSHRLLRQLSAASVPAVYHGGHFSR